MTCFTEALVYMEIMRNREDFAIIHEAEVSCYLNEVALLLGERVVDGEIVPHEEPSRLLKDEE